MVYIDCDIMSLNLEEALPLLSEQRRRQCLAYKHEQGRKASAAAYLLLLKALRQEYGIVTAPTFGFGPHGKPYIEGRPDIHFNLSHTKGAAVCAVSGRPIGVDIEAPRPYKPLLGRHTMSEEELSLIEQSEQPDVMFTRLWTMKEATLKLTGQGLISNMKGVVDTSRYKYTTVEDSQRRYVYTVCQRL